MTLYQFKMLDVDEQYDVVLNKSGIFVDNFINGSQRFNLYAIAKFFVEVEYSVKENRIINLRAFKTGDLLDKYSNINGLI
ncbi:hypothetical protein [Nonlabens ulvanivorans]|uniref:hypothetical protein n=1 Tax=Nonlabens ulvanivorans TaxID=906888 RepID=UPI0037C96252